MEHLHVAIVPRTDESPALVRISSTEFPVAGFALDTDPESGAPMLSLVLAPDSLTIGDLPAAVAVAPSKPATPNVGRWGDGTQPDPRENIPGWMPEKLGEQVADHAEHQAFGEESLRSRLRRLGGSPVRLA